MIQSFNQWGRLWVDFFGIAIIQNTVFLLIVIFALHLFRKAPARIQYGISLIGLIKLLFPPFLEAPFSISRSALIGDIGLSYAPEGAVSPAANQSFRLDGFGLLFISWIVVSASFMLFRIVSTILLKYRCKNGEILCDGINERASGRSAITIQKSDRIDVPVTIGVNPKTIFVPSHWDQWSADCRKAAVSHELAHIQRKDGMVRAFQMLAQALYFFHPLVWFLSKRMDEYREMSCDDNAVSFGKCTSVEYSRCLVEIAENMVHNRLGSSSASALIRRKHELLNRVKYQIMEGTMKQSLKLKRVIVLSGLFILFIPLSWYCGRKEMVKQVEQPASLPDSKTWEKLDQEIMTYPVDAGPQIVRRTDIAYPESAQKAKLAGAFFCYLRVNESGDVADVKIKDSLSPDCDQAAIEAMKEWKFTPAQKNGKPVAAWVVVPINFQLE